MKKTLLSGLLAASFLIFSCSKGGSKDCDPTVENLAGTYKIVSMKAMGQDILSDYLEPCEQDNKFVLNANGTYTTIDAGTACDPPSEGVGSWSITGNVFSFDELLFPMNIVSFDCKTLKVSYTEMGVTVEATLKKD